MEKVTGIGGIFFRAQDPEALAIWYRDNLGVSLVPKDATTTPWITETGITVFAPFAANTDYFRPENQVMVNFRVNDLEAMIAQLTVAGTEIFNRSEMDGIGLFAHFHDPEGNPVELWQPVP